MLTFKLVHSFSFYFILSFNVSTILSSLMLYIINLYNRIIWLIFWYINTLVLPFLDVTSIIGLGMYLSIMLQMLSGFFLAWYYIPEPGLIVELREEMFEETKYGYEIHQTHVKGVDVLFFLTYYHILKKIFLKNYLAYRCEGWIAGGNAYMWYHIVVFLGICLSGTHLSDLTLTIAANMYWSLTGNNGENFYMFFTNKHLNVDELVRLMILHYTSPFYYIYLVMYHIWLCHEEWYDEPIEQITESKIIPLLIWYYDAFLKELQDSGSIITYTYLFYFYHTWVLVSVAYYFFEKWNVAENDEFNFSHVAPHWYFKPYMGLLTTAPTHFEGLMWIILFWYGIAHMPSVNKWYKSTKNTMRIRIRPVQDSLPQSIYWIAFIASLTYMSLFLPCGRYFYDPEHGYWGNTGIRLAYQYAYFYILFLVHTADKIDQILYDSFEVFKVTMFKFFSEQYDKHIKPSRFMKRILKSQKKINKKSSIYYLLKYIDKYFKVN